MKKLFFFFVLMIASFVEVIFGQSIPPSVQGGDEASAYLIWQNIISGISYSRADTMWQDISYSQTKADTVAIFYQRGRPSVKTTGYSRFGYFAKLNPILLPDSIVGYFGNSYKWDLEKRNLNVWVSIIFFSTETGACLLCDAKLMENPNITKYVWKISKEMQSYANGIMMDGIGIIIDMGDSKNTTDVMVSKVEASDMKVYFDGKLLIHEPFKRLVTEVKGAVPTEFKLEQNYPNPFNPSTTITFYVPKAGNYKLEVYNLLGQKVETLIDAYLAPGKQEYGFNGKDLPSGIYVYRLTGENISLSKKMMLVK